MRQDDDSALQHARSLFYNKKYDEALDGFKMIVLENPHAEEAHLWIGYTYQAMGRLEEALRYFEGMVQRGSVNVQIFLTMASLHILLGNRRNVKDIISKVNKLPVTDAIRHQVIAEIYIQLNEEKAAAKHYQMALKLDPDNVNLLGNYGWVLIGLKQFGRARDMLKRACEFDSAPPATRYCLGIAEEASGNYEAALSAYQAAYGTSEDYYPEALEAIVRVLNHIGRSSEALNALVTKTTKGREGKVN